MVGFGFDVPGGELEYQYRVEVHVIGEVRYSRLTPRLRPPSITIKRKRGKVEVFFDFDSHVLREEEKKKLDRVKGRVRLTGHASPEGSEKYNLRLSQKRAESVAEYLKEKGVEVLEVKGLGERSCSLEPQKWSLCRKVEVKGE